MKQECPRGGLVSSTYSQNQRENDMAFPEQIEVDVTQAIIDTSNPESDSY